MRHLKSFLEKVRILRGAEISNANLEQDVGSVFPLEELEENAEFFKPHQLELLHHLYQPKPAMHRSVFWKFLFTENVKDIMEVYQFLLRVKKEYLLIDFIKSLNENNILEANIELDYFTLKVDASNASEKLQYRKKVLAALVNSIYSYEFDYPELEEALRVKVLNSFMSVYANELLQGKITAAELFLEIYSVSDQLPLTTDWLKLKPLLFGFLQQESFTEVLAGEIREMIFAQERGIKLIKQRLELIQPANYRDVKQLKAATQSLNDLLKENPRLVKLLNLIELLAVLAEFSGPFTNLVQSLLSKAGMNAVVLVDYPENLQEGVAFLRHFLNKLSVISNLYELTTLPELADFINIRRKKGVSTYIHDLAFLLGPKAVLQVNKLINAIAVPAHAAIVGLAEVEKMVSRVNFSRLEERLGDHYLAEIQAAKIVSPIFFGDKIDIARQIQHNSALIHKIHYAAKLHISQGGEKFTPVAGSNLHLQKLGLEYLQISKLEKLDEYEILLQPNSKTDQKLVLHYNMQHRVFGRRVGSRILPFKIQEWGGIVLEKVVLEHIEFVTSGRAFSGLDDDFDSLENMDEDVKRKIRKRRGYWRRLNHAEYKLQSSGAKAHRELILNDPLYGFDIMEVNKRRWLEGIQSPEIIRTFVQATEVVNEATEWEYFDS